MWNTSIFADLSAPTEIRDPTLSLDPASVLLDPTKRGLRDPTLRVCKTQLAWKNKRKPSLPLQTHLSDHHLEVVTSSINVASRTINPRPSSAKHHQSPKQPKQIPPKPPNASTKETSKCSAPKTNSPSSPPKLGHQNKVSKCSKTPPRYQCHHQ